MQRLIEEAKKARLNAYAPYSKFLVGAAIELKDGRIITGCNVENASYGLSLCAERNALTTLVTEGVKKEDIVRFVIIGDTKEFITPCGACRQFMKEFFSDDVEIILTNMNGDVFVTNMEGLLPHSFSASDL